MTRARILKSAQPAKQPPAGPGKPVRPLPWLAERPAPVDKSRTSILAAVRMLGRKFAASASQSVSGAFAISAIRRTRTATTTPALHNLACNASKGAAAPAKSASASAQTPLSLRKRAALLLAIITVPAMAAPSDFALFAAPDPAPPAPDPLALAAAQALPFERPGMSFPGSAFFFLDAPPEKALIALPTADPRDKGAEGGRELGEFIHTGPAAKPFFSTGTGLAHSRALDCLAQAVWYEAANESEAGQRAVAQVVLNRVAHPSWPASVCGVVYQGSERNTGCQFTFTCDGSLARRAGGTSWARAQAIASEALAGKVYAPIGHATHYHTLWVNPYWARSLDHVGTIGAHRFYRNRGAGGEMAAFSMAYAGFEPSVTGRTSSSGHADEAAGDKPTSASLAALPADAAFRKPPARSAKPEDKANERAIAKTEDTGNAAFGTAGAVRPEFANVGQWRTDPASLPLTRASPAADKSGNPALAH